MKTTFIYALNDPRTGLMRYIGKADNPQERLRGHIKKAKTNDCRGRWVSSLLAQGLKPELQILMEVPQEIWQSLERRFIQVFREVGMNLVNTTDGGDGGGMRGRHHSVGAREKIRIACLGRVKSPETREKLRLANLGKTLSPAHCAKIGMSKRGKIHSPETRAKIGAGNRGKIVSLETRAKMRLRRLSLEDRAKISVAHIGMKHSLESRAKMSASAYARKPKNRDGQSVHI